MLVMNLCRKGLFIISLLFNFSSLSAQHTLNNLVPANTARHTAQQSGDWFDLNTWAEGTIPGDAAIVYIPTGLQVTYEGQSAAHIFVISVEREGASAFSLYPNPSAGNIHLEFDVSANTTTEIIILDLLGRVIKEELVYAVSDGRSILTIDLKNIPSGTYYLWSRNNLHSKLIPFVLAGKE